MQLQLAVPTEAALQALASLLAYQALNPGDVYLLRGEVGAGKSTFSRAFIRAAAGDEELPVPSPTFLLQNTYGEDVLGQDAPPLHHFDLYRLTGPASTLERLDLGTCFSQAVCLVEWPERLPEHWLPASRLDVSITVCQDVGDPSTQQQPNETAAAVAAGQPGQAASGNDNEDGRYTDLRARAVQLSAFGDYWQERLQQVQHLLQSPEACGLAVTE